MSTLQERLAEAIPNSNDRGVQADIARLCGVSRPTVSAWFKNPEKVSTLTRSNAELICSTYRPDLSPAWLAEGKQPKYSPQTVDQSTEKATESGEVDEVLLTQYDINGGMDTCGKLILEAEPPGIIKSWRVDREWLRLNVPCYTSLQNLCIVTGFGPSMKPMFNPGDPLLMDRGVTKVDHEGVYFFRVGDEGYIKIIQRVPEFDGPGFTLRIISKNPDFTPYEISPKNPHFHVIGKILTVWKSEQY